jgi:hypothetical protein
MTGCPPVAETWELTKLLTVGERVDTAPVAVEVRNCGIAEKKAHSCSAGTTSELSLSQGFIFKAIAPEVSVALGLGRESGQSLELPPPPAGFIYRYIVREQYRVKTGELLARSQNGEEKKVPYTFHATCSLQLDPHPQILPCSVAATAISPTHTPVPVPTISLPATAVPSTQVVPTVSSLVPKPSLTPLVSLKCQGDAPYLAAAHDSQAGRYYLSLPEWTDIFPNGQVQVCVYDTGSQKPVAQGVWQNKTALTFPAHAVISRVDGGVMAMSVGGPVTIIFPSEYVQWSLSILALAPVRGLMTDNLSQFDGFSIYTGGWSGFVPGASATYYLSRP